MFEYLKLKQEIKELRESKNTLENKLKILESKRIDEIIYLLDRDVTCKSQEKEIIKLKATIQTQRQIIEEYINEKRFNRKRKTTI